MKNKKPVIVLLIVLLVLCVLLMEYSMYSTEAYNQKGGITDPVFGMKIACYDIFFGAICYAIGKLLNGKRKKLPFIMKFLGIWNFCGGILIELISIMR